MAHLLSTPIVCIFRDDSPYPVLEKSLGGIAKRWLARLANHGKYRRNPRTRAYMEALAAATIKGFDPSMVVDATELERVDWKAVREVVFLWPDSIGVGWRGIERDVFRRLDANARVMVLNGRRRYFNLREHGRVGFLWRRTLDKTFAFEFVFLAGFLVGSPVLALVDRVRGKR